MNDKTLLQSLRVRLDTRQISAVELTGLYLKNINRLNPELNALITISEDLAFAEAELADQMIKQKKQHFLTGIPIIHKDNFCTKGITTSCGSKMLTNFISPYDATVVKKCKEAGMVMLGKSNMYEFGMGSTNENSHYGAVKNPWNIEHVPGGSSGGSAAAVAAGLTPIATGTDTGGSVRQPAGFCGLTGMKPSYGSVSRFGMIAYGSSFDQAGVIAESVTDAAALLSCISGQDINDSTSIAIDADFFTKSLDQKADTLTIGIDDTLLSQLSDKAQICLTDCIERFKSLGVRFKPISLPDLDLAVAAYYILAPAEAATNLARYDGIRFGFRAPEAKTLDEIYTKSRSIGFGEEVKRRIIMGNYVLAASQYDAYFHQAQKLRAQFSQSIRRIFDEVDLILTPTSATTAFKLGAQSDPVSTYLSDLFTIGANLAGMPAVSFPIGFIDELPFGGQLMAKPFEDHKLIQAVAHFQQHSDWHLSQPEIMGELP
ncbi:MAG: Asp-tRNA(Asn)/Glu-tRNA(Gln) amidotransferase subunit GatA [Francisellaceae bacterium]